MAGLILNLFLDAVMALLLIITMVYCGRLSRRVKVLQDSKSELAQIIQEFDQCTRRATQSIAEIHEATTRISENIQHKIDKANYVADDLQFMIERGGKIAGGRTDEAAAARGRPNRSPEPEAMAEPMRRGAAPSRSKFDDEVSETAPEKERSAMDAMLRRVRGGGSEAPSGEIEAEMGRAKRVGARLRSKAEQELFEALKSGGSKG